MLHGFLVGLALLLVGEGLFFALWPQGRGPSTLVSLLSILPEEVRRWMGLVEACCGVALLYWVLG
jgi:uncharacterized protein YjeT (DUF2065 family)